MKRLIILIVLFISVNVNAKEWYEGGTLHGSSALEWQKATFQNKLATCGDFVSKAWENKSFKPEIQSKITSMDVIMVLAKELVKAIDIAFKEEPDAEKNKKI